ncbi:DUF2520 domain-containing protein [Schaalia sp. 19OD2882]|uniref:Rossmann-like and DUF2520 domain-containing protein n=1 Tax=Schaalia sp. 19OD2882 TaxID=2794089 RepID=UPI001C1ECB53|nr:DUF2520 domain-containing protein [Schaalia sp. 19OD2882]QWW20777.1 DUF2520 domain-containing protein [Schaalia sp. 19OD2882]
MAPDSTPKQADADRPAPSSRAGRLAVGVIGMGHVGPVIASALRAVGHGICAVSASSAASLERAETMLPGVPVLPPDQVVAASDLVFLAVPDDRIRPLVDGLASLGAWKRGQLVVHLSGAHGTDILDGAAQCGAIPLAIHPAMTFTGTSMDVARLEGTPFAVTASPMVLPIAQALVVEMGGEPVEVAEGDRIAYHAGLAHGANFLTVIVLQALETLRQAGIDQPGGFVEPLFRAALDRALREGTAAISGPVPRGDAGTVAEHVSALSHLEDLPGTVLDTYAFMTRQTVRMLVDAGRLDRSAADALLAALTPTP